MIRIYLVAGIIITSSGTSWTQGIRHIHPPLPAPSPGPPPQLLQEAFSIWSSKEVVKAFKDQGLEVMEVKPGFIIGTPGARESTIFLMPTFGKDIGSVVSSYLSEDDLQRSLNYYSRINKKTRSPWWIFRKNNILVLLSGRVSEETARHYEEALKNMKKE